MFQPSRSHRRAALLAGAALAVGCSLFLPFAVQAQTRGPDPGQRRQRAFIGAAGEFHVPLPVLLAVGYEESRWEGHAGHHSTSGGYGPMHLTDLTPRELAVLELVAAGLTNRQVGERLYISQKTVSVHLSRVMAKFGAATRTEAVAVAHDRGVLS